jgi:hypothetical protein
MKPMESEEALSGKLEICQVDLLDYRSVFGNINGCSGVLHVPAPYDHLDGSWIIAAFSATSMAALEFCTSLRPVIISMDLGLSQHFRQHQWLLWSFARPYAL